jgi:predicted ATPase/HPt (histidine-containing phosphotransfer) domain-containing protein
MGLEGYEVGEVIAQSPHSVVRRALRRRDGARVVVKLHAKELPTARESGQLEFEYRMLRKLHTPGVVRALDLSSDGDRLALVLEDFGGVDLSIHGAPLALDLFFTVAIGVAGALQAVHRAGIIHKDVTPRNVVINPATREVKLIDFGIATELSQERQTIEVASRIEGTLPYMSPEQTGRMNRDLDYRSDYYSLGATLFELLTGAPPFSAGDAMGWLHCHISRPAPSPRDIDPAIPEPVARIVLKLLAKNPDDRYQSSHGLVSDLERCRREWRERGAIDDFVLGAADVPERFQVSQKLFGREHEAATLHAAFAQASRGAARLLLVGGYSGVGKSALIHELQKDIVRGHGHFIGGKFDQLDRNVPYAAVTQAIRGLVKQLLGEPEDVLARWRRDLSAAVGSAGRVLTDLVPELAEILGPQPSVPALAPREAHVRFQRVFREFLKASATADHPLVLFIDDLQWADPSTPELLVYVISEEALQHLLVIGAYRDNEVHSGHPLRVALADLEAKQPGAVREIQLSPLSEDDVNRLVADTLHRDAESCRPISALIAQKTGGNPFFVKELLAMLARDGAFTFVAEHGRWDWDEARIERAAISENVIDLMVQQLRELPAETTDALRWAACIGSAFELSRVAGVAGKAPGQLSAALWPAVRERVLVPIGSAYRLVHDGRSYDPAGPNALHVRYAFAHDRIQQAAYSLVEETDRPRRHLAIGRLLRAATNEAQTDEELFETVNHLNMGRALVTDDGERRDLSRLNERAGARAQRANAYALASDYYRTSVDLLVPEERVVDAHRVFDCERNRIECIFYSGDPDQAERLCTALADGAPDRWSKIAALELKSQILDHQGRLLESIVTLREGLRLVGVELPEDVESIGRLIGEGIGKMQAHLARVPIEDLVLLPEMTDREKTTTFKLLFHLVVPSIQAFPPLFILSELMMFDLALTAGVTDLSCKNFVDCGIIQGGILGDHDRAYRLGKVAFEFLKRDGARPLAPAVSFVFAGFVSHWRAHYRESLETFADTERLGIELGDNWHLSYAHTLMSQRWFFAGKPLAECRDKVERAAGYLTRIRATNQLDGVRLVEHAIARFTGASPPLADPEDAFTTSLIKAGNAQWLFHQAHANCFASVVFGDYEAAARWDAFSLPYDAGGKIQYVYPDHHVLRTLILARRWSAAPEGEARAVLAASIDDSLAQLARWAESSPGNYAAKHRLAAAEVARVRGAPLEQVLALYDEVTTLAGEDFLPWRALANELQAEHWASRGQAKIARLFLVQAERLYERWGATAKVRQMRARHPQLLEVASAQDGPAAHTTSRGRGSGHGTLELGSVDLESMIKATQAISSEVKPERLFARLMAALVENAGAQRGCLVFRDESTGELRVEAYAGIGATPAEARPRTPLAECAELSPDIVRYVARTQATVVVDDALNDPAHREDEHIQRDGVKSVLCMPVLHQTRLVAVLYAENNAATHAFTPERLRLLQVIASQAAISITNAHIYDSLEERVDRRTRELAEKNREVAAMLHSIQQGVFTIDEALTIQPQYSGHLAALLGTKDIAGRDCLPLLFGNSNIGADGQRAMRSALEFSFGVAPFIAEVNAPHLVRRFQRVGPDGDRRDFEADWTYIADDEGLVHKVLVAVRDVTALKRLTESVAQKARELDMVGQILDAGLDAFQRFSAGARSLVAESLTALDGSGPVRADLERLFRNIHTLKGDARMLGLSYIVEAAHAAEQAHDEARRAHGGPPPSDRLRAALSPVEAQLDDYENVFKHKLAQLGASTEARQSAALTEIGASLHAATSGSLNAGDALRAISRSVNNAHATPLQEVVRETARMLPSLARELAKPAPEVDCPESALRLTADATRVVRDVLIHALRNAMDHGIESPDERVAAGKPARGRIAVRARRQGSVTGLVVSDDGRGLGLSALRAKIGDLSSDDDTVADAVFRSGVSTAASVSSTSGRGVGMDIVRSVARRLGGDARVVFTGPLEDGRRPFELVIELPDAALVRIGGPSGSIAPPPGPQHARA